MRLGELGGAISEAEGQENDSWQALEERRHLPHGGRWHWLLEAGVGDFSLWLALGLPDGRWDDGFAPVCPGMPCA